MVSLIFNFVFGLRYSMSNQTLQYRLQGFITFVVPSLFFYNDYITLMLLLHLINLLVHFIKLPCFLTDRILVERSIVIIFLTVFISGPVNISYKKCLGTIITFKCVFGSIKNPVTICLFLRYK